MAEPIQSVAEFLSIDRLLIGFGTPPQLIQKDTSIDAKKDTPIDVNRLLQELDIRRIFSAFSTLEVAIETNAYFVDRKRGFRSESLIKAFVLRNERALYDYASTSTLLFLLRCAEEKELVEKFARVRELSYGEISQIIVLVDSIVDGEAMADVRLATALLRGDVKLFGVASVLSPHPLFRVARSIFTVSRLNYLAYELDSFIRDWCQTTFLDPSGRWPFVPGLDSTFDCVRPLLQGCSHILPKLIQLKPPPKDVAYKAKGKADSDWLRKDILTAFLQAIAELDAKDEGRPVWVIPRIVEWASDLPGSGFEKAKI